MDNLHSLFLRYNDVITISKTNKDKLKRGRDATRQDILTWFRLHDKEYPNFCWQGSFAMKTTINPIEGDFDIDDGVYLNGYSNTDKSDWPSAATVHNWLIDAVNARTSKAPINKNACVRVDYSENYHIDIASYIYLNDTPYLGKKNDGWGVSDAKGFTNWFKESVKNEDEQLRRIVKYLKGWKDYKQIPFKGIEITILATNNYNCFEGYDEKSLNSTICSIINSLEIDFSCNKPVAPFENLFADASYVKKQEILNGLKKLKQSLELAINEPNIKRASEYMQKEFGDRFPLGKDLEPDSNSEQSSYTHTKAPGVLHNDGRSARPNKKKIK